MTETGTRSLQAAAGGLMLMMSIQQAQAGLAPNWEESGVASWYGTHFVGRRTSSGSRFDQNAMTAAHDTLPLGTRLRVTMQETGRSVVVVVTDRMPPKYVRVIDLSRGAAAALGIIASGTGMVTLTEAAPSDPVEVAEAPDDEPLAVNPRRRGRPHTHHAVQRAWGRS